MLPTHALAMQPSRAWMRAVPVRLPNALTDQIAKPAKREEHRGKALGT